MLNADTQKDAAQGERAANTVSSDSNAYTSESSRRLVTGCADRLYSQGMANSNAVGILFRKQVCSSVVICLLQLSCIDILHDVFNVRCVGGSSGSIGIRTVPSCQIWWKVKETILHSSSVHSSLTVVVTFAYYGKRA